MRIIGFTGYHDGKALVVKGRLITQEYKAPKKESSWIKNLKSNVARIRAKPLRQEKVTISLGRQQQETTTDNKGFFRSRFKKRGRGWQKATVRAKNETATIDVLASTDKKGLISDVDDTFLTTHTNHFLKKIRLYLLKNAKTREAVEGMPAFYRSTDRQAFYVSSSSWELYDLIKDFCETQDMPKGPYLLSDKRVTALKKEHHDKERRIREILSGYDTTFILIGDDAQRDPYIYREVAKQHPEKIEAILIRSVKDPQRTRALLKRCGKPFIVERSAKALRKRYRLLTKKK